MVQKTHSQVLKALAAQIAKLEAAIFAKVRATPEFAERAEIIESVPGLAGTISAILIAGAPELGKVSDEIAAALIGAAPLTTMTAASAEASATSRGGGAG